MRYHYIKPDFYSKMYGRIYECNHPVYSRCTLFEIGKKGLAVIQQRYNRLYLHPNFKKYFDDRAGECTDGIYPTVTIRQMMWALKMKPIQRQRWETCFDRRDV